MGLYTIPNTSIGLTIQKVSDNSFFLANSSLFSLKDSLSALLQQIVVPGALIEPLGKAKSAIDLLIAIGDPLSQVGSLVIATEFSLIIIISFIQLPNWL